MRIETARVFFRTFAVFRHDSEAYMGILGWIVLGGLAGWIAKSITGVGARRGCLFNVLIGIIGSVLGGLLFSYFGKQGVTGFNFWSLFVAASGAVAFLLIARLLGGGDGKG
jgi:uncharacterized membrane protein YeaQ/YmgE (transglycosylase-associated protein family)